MGLCLYMFIMFKYLYCDLVEASSLDQIKMAKNLLEYEQNIFTMTNLIF